MRVFELFLNGLAMFGFDPRATLRNCHGIPFYLRDFFELRRQGRKSGISFPFGVPFPCLTERFEVSGGISGAYFHQDLLVARRIFASNPKMHVDVGSRIDGFVAHVASFRKIRVMDIRELPGTIANVEFVQMDMMKEIPEHLVASTDSLSCLHAIEHFGLGRYGDPIRFDGYLLGLDNLYRLLKPGGKLYFSVPIGPQRIEYNAHRIFSVRYLLDLFRARYSVVSFSFIDDQSELHESVTLDDVMVQNNFGCSRGCGIFELIKRDDCIGPSPRKK